MRLATQDDEQVLVDPELDERLAQDGMVTVPLVGRDELAEVEAAYWDLVPAGEQGIVLDYLRDDRALVATLAELMAPVWEREVPQVLEHHYPVYTSFVVKHPGEDSSLFLHRDLSVDDERFRRTLSMWMPFEDTGPELDNGPLAFVRDSNEIHYGGFGPNAVGLFAPYDRHLQARLEPIAVPAGSAVIYDARLLHASAPNRSDRARLAVGCLLARRDHPTTQVVARGRRHRVVHAVDPTYFVDFAPADIARDGMPDRFPVIDEYDEEPAVTTSGVLGRSLDPSVAERDVVVPDDLDEVAGRRAPLERSTVRRPRHDHDLAITAGQLSAVGDTVIRDVAATSSGAVGVVEVVRGARRVDPVPPAVPDVVVPLDPFRTSDLAMVVIDAGGRLTLTSSDRLRRRHELVVIECPAVRAGACTADHVAELDLGTCLALEPGRALHVWNEGPGPLVVAVRSARTLG